MRINSFWLQIVFSDITIINQSNRTKELSPVPQSKHNHYLLQFASRHASLVQKHYPLYTQLYFFSHNILVNLREQQLAYDYARPSFPFSPRPSSGGLCRLRWGKLYLLLCHILSLRRAKLVFFGCASITRYRNSKLLETRYLIAQITTSDNRIIIWRISINKHTKLWRHKTECMGSFWGQQTPLMGNGKQKPHA